MFPRKYLPLLLMMLPFISGFSDHWLRAERPWKKWPLQPKVAFSADVISRTGFGSSKGRIYFSPPGQLRVETFDTVKTEVAVLNPVKGKLYQWAVDPSTGKVNTDPPFPSEMPIESYWQNVAVEGSYWVLPVNIRESSLVKEGDQLINGIETTRYRADMDAGKELRKAQVWIARKSGIVVRFETSPDGWPFVSGMELSNLHIGHQAPELFELPKVPLAGPNKQASRSASEELSAGPSGPADQSAWLACREAPTRRCVLDHAREIGRTTPTSLFRARDLVRIARAQADAGLTQEASATIDLLKAEEVANVPGSVARIKAETGKLDEAAKIADAISDPAERGLIIGSIAVAEGEAGKIDDALRRVQVISDDTARAFAIRRAAWGLRTIAVQRGDDDKIVEALRQVESIRLPISGHWHPSMHAAALEIIVDAQLRAGKIAEAVKAATAVQSEPSDQAQVFAAIVRFLARTGRVVEALRIALAIDSDALRGGALALATEPSPLVDINFDPDRHSELATIRQAKVGPGALAVAKSFSEPNRSVALRLLAEAQANADDPAQALEAAKLIDDQGQHIKALIAVAKAQTRAGQRGPAGVSFGEALQIAQTVRFSKDTLTESIAIAEAEADRIDEARALVEQIQDRTWHSGALTAIARALARAGRAAEAREAAEQARTSSPFPDLAKSREAIIQGFVEGGHIAEAVETARTMERQESVLYTVADSLCDAGNAKAALQLAQAMAPGDRLQAMAPREGLHVPALLKIAHTLRDAGADAEAASALREVLNVITAEPNQYRLPDELVSLSYALPD
jgi:tetratricopeptide (TPR) repeat protein